MLKKVTFAESASGSNVYRIDSTGTAKCIRAALPASPLAGKSENVAKYAEYFTNDIAQMFVEELVLDARKHEFEEVYVICVNHDQRRIVAARALRFFDLIGVKVL